MHLSPIRKALIAGAAILALAGGGVLVAQPTYQPGIGAATAAKQDTTNTNLGAPGATVCATDTGSCSINALLQRIAQRLTTLGAPVSVTTTDKAGTITTGGTAQTAIASNASRRTWCIQNPSNATESLRVRSNGTASASTGIELVAGAMACNQTGTVDTSAVSIFGLTTGHAWNGFETQ